MPISAAGWRTWTLYTAQAPPLRAWRTTKLETAISALEDLGAGWIYEAIDHAKIAFLPPIWGMESIPKKEEGETFAPPSPIPAIKRRFQRPSGEMTQVQSATRRSQSSLGPGSGPMTAIARDPGTFASALTHRPRLLTISKPGPGSVTHCFSSRCIRRDHRNWPSFSDHAAASLRPPDPSLGVSTFSPKRKRRCPA